MEVFRFLGRLASRGRISPASDGLLNVAKEQTGLRFLSSAAAWTFRSPSSASRAWSLAFAGAGLGIAALSLGSESWAKEKTPVPAETVEDRYTVPPVGSVSLPSSPITLYQYEVCPFCCKVKAFLDYHKIPYRVVEVNPLTKAELKWSEYKKVPVAIIDDAQFNDSSMIISHLSACFRPTEHSASPGFFASLFGSASSADAGRPAQDEEVKWRRWVDDRFVRVVTCNIYRSASEAWQTFDYIAENGNFGLVQRELARVVGAGMMWSLSGKLRKKYGVDRDVRAELYTDAADWVGALKGRTFHGGSSPDLADLAVFGVIRSIAGTDTFNDLMHNTEIGRWYEIMFNAVGESSRITENP